MRRAGHDGHVRDRSSIVEAIFRDMEFGSFGLGNQQSLPPDSPRAGLRGTFWECRVSQNRAEDTMPIHALSISMGSE